MASRPLLRVRGIDGSTHRACRDMQTERLTFVRHICLGNMPSLTPFKGVLLPSVPALLVKLNQCLPSVLPLQVRAPFPDQSGQLSAAIPPLHFKSHRRRPTMAHQTILHYTTTCEGREATEAYSLAWLGSGTSQGQSEQEHCLCSVHCSTTPQQQLRGVSG